jgi:hypothetical protein
MNTLAQDIDITNVILCAAPATSYFTEANPPRTPLRKLLGALDARPLLRGRAF